MKKLKAFPNETFKTQNEYLDFAIKNNVFGNEAYKLKKKIMNIGNLR